MNEITSQVISAVKDEVTGKDIIWPSYEKLVIPKTPNYRNGVRSNVASFGTTNLEKFVGTPENLISDINADFKAIKVPSYRLTSAGEYEVVPNNSFLVNSKTDDIIGKNITDRYSIFDFDTAIYYFLAMLEMVKKMGLEVTPAYGKVWQNGAKMFLQYKVGGTTIMGEKVDSYMSLVTSHDKSSGFIIALSAVRLFCQNQIHRMLKEATNKLSLKHTAGNQRRIEVEANKLIESQKTQMKALEAYAQSLAKVKISEKDIFDNYAAMKKVGAMTTQRQVDTFTENAQQLIACYRQPDVANFTNTALGAYYAYSDFSQHCVPTRKTSDQSYIESALDGNLVLGDFTDMLVSRVSM